jgi:hypothetical protein
MLFVSGYTNDSPAMRSGLRTAGRAFLLKPFTRVALLGKIRDVLQRGARSSRPAASGG